MSAKFLKITETFGQAIFKISQLQSDEHFLLCVTWLRVTSIKNKCEICFDETKRRQSKKKKTRKKRNWVERKKIDQPKSTTSRRREMHGLSWAYAFSSTNFRRFSIFEVYFSQERIFINRDTYFFYVNQFYWGLTTRWNKW